MNKKGKEVLPKKKSQKSQFLDGNFNSPKFKLKYKTHVNLVWGKPIGPKKREAIAYTEGFPATVYMTSTRVFVLGIFMEKHGLLGKRNLTGVYFEASLEHIKEVELGIYKKVRSGYISFNPHGRDIENGIIHFIRLEPDLIQAINEVIDNLKKVKKFHSDSGVVELTTDPYFYLRKRL